MDSKISHPPPIYLIKNPVSSKYSLLIIQDSLNISLYSTQIINGFDYKPLYNQSFRNKVHIFHKLVNDIL